MITTKRIYEEASKEDGFRILVDRLWPRGISKENAKIDLRLKEIAPSNSLRKRFAHDADKWLAFQKKYTDELKEKHELIKDIQEREKNNAPLLIKRYKA